MEEYNFTVVHRKGSQHNADALSRLPCRQCGRDSHITEHSDASLLEVMEVVTSSPFQTYSTEEIRKLQIDDPIIEPVYGAVKSGRRPLVDLVSAWQRESKWLLQQWESLCRRNVFERLRTKPQMVLPYSLHEVVLKELHEGAVAGHLGESKMLGRLKERFYWPGCGDAVSNHGVSHGVS